MKRDKILRVRLSVDEKEQLKIKAKAAGITASALVRKTILESQVVIRRPDRDIPLHLARIGNNVNQLARWANTHKGVGDVIQVVSMLMAFMREVKVMKEQR